jgi:hypothetical protein
MYDQPKTRERQEAAAAMILCQQDRERQADAEHSGRLAALVRLERDITEDQAFDALCRARDRR